MNFRTNISFLLAVLLLVFVQTASGQTVGKDGQPINEQDRRQLQRAVKSYNSALKLRTAGDIAKATDLAKQALEIEEAILGSESNEISSSLRLLAELYESQGNYARALPLLKRSVMIKEKVLGPDHPDMGLSLNNLASLYYSQGEYASALPLFQRALKIKEKALGPDHPDTATSLNNLALLHKSQGDYASALPLYQRSLKIREKVLGPDHPDTGSSLNNVGDLYYTQGNYTRALPLFERALKIDEKAFGPDHPDTSASLNNLALLYDAQGDFARALPLFQRALKIDEKALGPDHPDTGISLNNLALLYDAQGDYAKALPLFLRALKIDEKTLGPDHPDTGTSLNNLALLYKAQGDYASALPLFERALKIDEKALGPDHPDTALTLNNLATLYDAQGDYANALPLFQRSLKITEKSFGPDHPDTAQTLNNLARLYRSQGDYARALPMYQRSLKIYEKTLGPDHPETGTSLHNLASLYSSQGDYANALPLHRRSLKIWEEALGADHPKTANSLNNLATAMAEQGNYRDSGVLFDRARKSAANHVSRILPSLAAKEQQRFLKEKYFTALEKALSYGMHYGAKTDEGTSRSATWLANGKGVGQQALAQRNSLTRDIRNPKKAAIVKQLLATRDQLAKLAMAAADPDQVQQRLETIERLNIQDRELSLQLGGGQNDASSEWVELDALKRSVPDDGVLVDIARFEVFNLEAPDGQDMWQPARYVAWITYPDSKPVKMVDLGLAKEIEELIKQLRDKLRDSEDELDTAGEEITTKRLRFDMKKLSKKIWQPIANELSGVENIALSPDGMLWLVPWATLPMVTDGDAEDESQYLIEKYNLRLLTSARDLLAKPDSRPTKAPVVFANPSFDQAAEQKQESIRRMFKKLPAEDASPTRSIAPNNLLSKVQPLPNTGKEANAIKPSIKAYTLFEPILYTKRWALEHTAKKLKSPKIAAFATHGFFLPTQEVDRKNSSRAGLAGQHSVALDKNNQPLENPLLRCGLLLSGCNNRDSVVGDDDGILTGMEITAIDFRGTKLVVLSACDTGIGDIRNGEGVAGLRQAFQLAGAESILASLWKVNDAETAELMNLFFENLAAGKTKSESLRQAQLARIKIRRELYGAAHPYYWAAFTLTGQD